MINDDGFFGGPLSSGREAAFGLKLLWLTPSFSILAGRSRIELFFPETPVTELLRDAFSDPVQASVYSNSIYISIS